MYALHPTLKNDTLPLLQLKLSELLLMNDARFPWLILVPRVAGASEWFDLNTHEQKKLHDEVMHISIQLKHLLQADKMNIAALGNMVPQLHVHIIARFKHDAAWPKPVWGMGEAVPYQPETLPDWVKSMRQ